MFTWDMKMMRIAMREIKFRAWDRKDKVIANFGHADFSVVCERIRNYALGFDSEGNYRRQDNLVYMQYTGLDMAKIRENQRPVAEENVKTDLVLDAIAKAENIQVDMADVDAEIAAISAQHGASPEEVKKIIKANGTMGLLLANIVRRKAAHVVIDSAK